MRARVVIAYGETEPPTGFVSRFGFRAFDGDPRWCYLRMQDVEATISAPATPPQRTTVQTEQHPIAGRPAGW
jgi:hypothetical protein